jgi:tetratricopeptide (TPR) repeat protein
LDASTEQLGPHHTKTLNLAHQLAIAMWAANEVQGAVDILNLALSCIKTSLGKDHPIHTDVLCTLGRIVFDLGHLEQACTICRQVLESRVRQNGLNHPRSIEAESELAAVLFETGQQDKAERIEHQAYEMARQYLGKTHFLTTALAWNRAINYERSGEMEAAKDIIINKLTWLLTEDPSVLNSDQAEIRAMLAGRLDWDGARSC